MARGFWSAFSKFGRKKSDATAQPAPGEAADSAAAPKKNDKKIKVNTRRTVTESGRPHLVVTPVKAKAPKVKATAKPAKAARKARKAAKGDKPEQPKVTRLRTRHGDKPKKGLLARRRALKAAGLEVMARREDSLSRMQSSFRQLGSSLQDIHATMQEQQARTAAVAEKLHHVPEILSALPAITERQQATLDRMAARTEALAVIPQALAAVREHAEAQIATLGAIRNELEKRAAREEQMVARLSDVSQAMHDVSDQAQAQIDEIRTLGEGQHKLVDATREVGQRTSSAIQESQESMFMRMQARDRQRRNRLLAMAAGLGIGIATLGTVAAHAGAKALHRMTESAQMLAETAGRDMRSLRGEMSAVSQLERQIADREGELRLLLAAARNEMAAARNETREQLQAREAELAKLQGELAALKGRPAPKAGV
ncbi:MAG: hypothetical protein ACYTGX_16190, partial [Planctomycetota bacterium]